MRIRKNNALTGKKLRPQMNLDKKIFGSDTALDFSSCVFFSLACTSNYLLYTVYPLFSWEALNLACAFGLVLLSVLLVLKTVRARWLFYVFLICLFFDLHYGFANRPLWEYCPRPYRGGAGSQYFLAGVSGIFAIPRTLTWFSSQMRHMAVMNHVLAAALACAVVWRFRKFMPRFLANALALLFFTTLIRFTIAPESLFRTSYAAKAAAAPKAEGDVFIFFVDEHIGLEGIPSLDGLGETWEEKLRTHYQQRGFTLFSKAYSNYFDTHNSIPSLLNYTLFDQNTYMTRVRENRLLESFLQQDRPLNIYQTNSLDFCGSFRGRTAQCFQYRANAAGSLAHSSLTPSEKTLFLADSFVAAHRSELLQRIYRGMMHKAGRQLRTQTGPVPVMQVFEQIKKDAQTAPIGTVFFAHLLMPHYPYVYDSNCRLKPLHAWEDRDVDGFGNTRAGWKKRYRKYAGQSICLDHKFEDFFKTLDAQQRYENATIVIFSDHGSRITLASSIAQKVNSFVWDDWMAGFSALAAVKPGLLLKDAPLLKNPLYEKRIPLAELLNTLFQFSPGNDDLKKKFERVYLRKNWESSGFSGFEFPDS